MKGAVLLAVLALAACAFGSSPEERLDSRPEPPSLLIDDAEGSHSLRPTSFCWDYRDGPGITGICTESVGPLGDLPEYVQTEDAPITLNFQFSWEQLDASVRPEDGSCDPYLIAFIEPRDSVFNELGPPGEYLIEIDVSGQRGDAHWTIRIDNRADVPYPETADC